MDTALILKKLEALERCIRRIESKRPDSAELLRESLDLQDILAVNLERAVQTCVDVASHILAESSGKSPETMGECFERLAEAGIVEEPLATRMQKAVGFRNIAVHEYEEIDWDIVFAIVTRDLEDFRAFARATLRHCERAGA